jgi:hypothetical protein
MACNSYDSLNHPRIIIALMFEVTLAYFDLFPPVNQRFFHFQIFRSNYIGLDGYNIKAKIYRAKKLKLKKSAD